ncbi:hypothetical protein B0H10DRAFT_587296 [Mycena sp. CBHHK59/15]|nr:hypothetical protein B0H10DRAFT_587296 [Mycena sp. CBHHK59/15]
MHQTRSRSARKRNLLQYFLILHARTLAAGFIMTTCPTSRMPHAEGVYSRRTGFLMCSACAIFLNFFLCLFTSLRTGRPIRTSALSVMEASRLIWALAPAPCPRPSQTSGSLKNPALHTPQPIALQRKHAPTHRHREASAHPMRSTYPMLRPIFPLSGTTTRPRPIARSCFREGGDASTSCPLLMAHGWAGVSGH